jgi:hypothetical protein
MGRRLLLGQAGCRIIAESLRPDPSRMAQPGNSGIQKICGLPSNFCVMRVCLVSFRVATRSMHLTKAAVSWRIAYALQYEVSP